MKTQTFEERVADETKSQLAPQFIQTIYSLAEANSKTPTEMYEMWKKHVKINESSDQSPTVIEFIRWNSLKEVA